MRCGHIGNRSPVLAGTVPYIAIHKYRQHRSVFSHLSVSDFIDHFFQKSEYLHIGGLIPFGGSLIGIIGEDLTVHFGNKVICERDYVRREIPEVYVQAAETERQSRHQVSEFVGDGGTEEFRNIVFQYVIVNPSACVRGIIGYGLGVVVKEFPYLVAGDVTVFVACENFIEKFFAVESFVCVCAEKSLLGINAVHVTGFYFGNFNMAAHAYVGGGFHIDNLIAVERNFAYRIVGVHMTGVNVPHTVIGKKIADFHPVIDYKSGGNFFFHFPVRKYGVVSRSRNESFHSVRTGKGGIFGHPFLSFVLKLTAENVSFVGVGEYHVHSHEGELTVNSLRNERHLSDIEVGTVAFGFVGIAHIRRAEESRIVDGLDYALIQHFCQSNFVGIVLIGMINSVLSSVFGKELPGVVKIGT